MSALNKTCKMLNGYTSIHKNIRPFSCSLTCQKNPALLRNRFIIVPEKNHTVKKTAVKSSGGMNHGYPTGLARRIPYKRPYIAPYPTNKEIPYHYREGVNKELLIPHMKKLKIKKYKNRYEERNHYRTAFQRLANKGKALIPYDKKISALTGKHTGPGVEGGTDLAQKMAALHLVQPTGYVDKWGNFQPVKEMVPEMVVPKLDDFKLKAYVSYRATDINQSKFTARSLYNAFYADKAQERFEEEMGVKPVVDIKSKQKDSLLSKYSKYWPKKKSSS